MKTPRLDKYLKQVDRENSMKTPHSKALDKVGKKLHVEHEGGSSHFRVTSKKRGIGKMEYVFGRSKHHEYNK